MNNWNTNEPPKDGSVIVAVGRVIVTDEISTSVDSFVAAVRNEPITQDGFQYALAYCAQLGLSLDHAAQLRRQYDGHCNQMADASMETACGIA